MTTVRTASRLHFGLFGLEDFTPWANREGTLTLPGRAFGGVGLMVEDPGVRLGMQPAAEWKAEGPLAERALAFAQRYTAAARLDNPGRDLPPQHLVIEHAAPEHTGLGTGTQLGLAVGLALARAWGLDEAVPGLARQVGRGMHSGLGIHGFERGGFIVEAGKRSPAELSPLVARAPFPEAWRIVLIMPSTTTGLHGPREQEAFGRLAKLPPPRRQSEALCRLALLGLLPLLVEQDLESFGEALYDFNARSGELFAPVQGGIYSGTWVAEVVALIRGMGIRGVGQSSWGPTVFALAGDSECAADVAKRVGEQFGLGRAEAVVTHARNRGAAVS